MAREIKFHFLEESKTKPFTDCFNYPEGLARSEPGGFLQTVEFSKHFEEFINFRVRDDDVWVVTFPKCGTTWTQEMVWMIMNDCNEELAQQKPLLVRSPFLEISRMEKIEDPQALLAMAEFLPSVDAIDKMPSPRIIKSHLPFYLLPPNLLEKSKVVYVARNPKDVIVSYFNHHKFMKLPGLVGDLDSFAKHFMKDEVLFAPYFPHILDAWRKRDSPNILFLFYEDMKKNLRGELEKISKFLNKPLTEEKMTLLLNHLKFENIAKNESVNYEIGKKLGFANHDVNFMRKGKTGDWKNHFSPELNRCIDEWIEKNLAGTDLKFVLELEQQD